LIIKKFASVLNKQISADNQLLILASWTILLQQTPALIATALWRVIHAAGVIMTGLREHQRTVLFCKARNFLTQTICKFSNLSVFLIICKASKMVGCIEWCINIAVRIRQPTFMV
jgi:hypothetical protein